MLIPSDSINALKRIDCFRKCVDISEGWYLFKPKGWYNWIKFKLYSIWVNWDDKKCWSKWK